MKGGDSTMHIQILRDANVGGKSPRGLNATERSSPSWFNPTQLEPVRWLFSLYEKTYALLDLLDEFRTPSYSDH